MKKLLLSLSGLLLCCSAALAGNVNFNIATDSTFNPCQVPNNVMFLLSGNATGYNTGDQVQIYTAFGDGQDTTISDTIRNNRFALHFYHNYTMAGNYTVMYVVTGPDGASDTLVQPNEVLLGNSCENISGRVYNDIDSDCNYTPQTDMPIRRHAVELLLNGNVNQLTYTDSSGQYSFDAVSGYNYEVEVRNSALTLTCPSSGGHTVNSLPANNLDFALECPGSSQHDLSGHFSGGFLVPGVKRGVFFHVRNQLCQPVSGTAKLVLNSQVQYTPSSSSAFHATPDRVIGDTLFYDFNNLQLNDRLSMRADLTGDTTLSISDSVCLELIVTPRSGDADTANNTLIQCLEVRTSYDPNMKSVNPAGLGTDGRISRNRTMLYTLHFQNTGNFRATNVYILDTIDTATLDINTLEIVDYSHPMELKMPEEDILRFNFDNIMLPDSNSNEPESHGFVSFRIDQVSGLADGSRIENTVGIFFDYNPPIITNTTVNTIDMNIGIEEMKTGSPVSIFDAYPNPVHGSVQIELLAPFREAQLEIVNLSGQRLLHRTIEKDSRLDLSEYPRGVYILKLSSEGHQEQKRILTY